MRLTNDKKVKINKRNIFTNYYFLYSILFLMVCSIVFCWYFCNGRTLIWKVDGWHQHYKALVYYAKYLRNILKELFFNHHLVIPEWDFAFGEGNDILQTLHYYVIGDPFALLSVLIPTRYMWIYYEFSILLRLYLTGIAFSYMCFYVKKGIGCYAVMAGTLSYVFCFYSLLIANRHPYWLNPMLYFPLIIVGIEKILRKERINTLVLSVFLAAISNLYYFYVIVFLTVVYVAVRLLYQYRSDLKSMLLSFLKIAGSSLLGVMMGGIILLPAVFAFLNDGRMGSGNAWHYIYPVSYYSSLPGMLFSGWNGKYTLCLAVTAPAVLAVFMLFLNKGKNIFLKICFVICSVIIAIPAFGQILNGMSYMCNRWSWAFVLLFSYILAVMWQDLMNLTQKNVIKLGICLCGCFLGLLMLEKSRTMGAFVCIVIAFLFLFVLFPFQFSSHKTETVWYKRKQFICLSLVIAGIAIIGFFLNTSDGENYASQGVDIKKAKKELTMTEAAVINNIDQSEGEDNFYRYSGRGLTTNGGTLIGISSSDYYWSISKPDFAAYMREMELLETLIHNHSGYDDRTMLNTLNSVKYYAVPDSDNEPMPYGYYSYMGKFNVKEEITNDALNAMKEELGTEELTEEQVRILENSTALKYNVYKNDNMLPLAYTYENIVSQNMWEQLTAVEKQSCMMQAVLLADYDGETQDDKVSFNSRSVDYTIKANSSDVTLEDYGFVVTKEKASVTFEFEGLEDSETYFCIKGLDFDGIAQYDLYYGDDKYDPLNLYTKTRWNLLSNKDRENARKQKIFGSKPFETCITVKSSLGIEKYINYYTEDYFWYNDRHDFSVNLDYTSAAVTSVTLTFSTPGIYSFDSIDIVCQPMNQYVDQVDALKENVLENEEIITDTIKGNISLDNPGVLFLSVPYSVGWTAYVDGEQTRLYKANIKNMAVILNAGNHVIELTYHTPYLREGAILSIAGLVIFILSLLFGKYTKVFWLKR